MRLPDKNSINLKFSIYQSIDKVRYIFQMWKSKIQLTLVLVCILPLFSMATAFQRECAMCGDKCCDQQELASSHSQQPYESNKKSVYYQQNDGSQWSQAADQYIAEYEKYRQDYGSSHQPQKYSLPKYLDQVQSSSRGSQQEYRGGFVELHDFSNSKQIVDILRYLQSQFPTDIFLYTQLISVQYKKISSETVLYLLSLEVPMPDTPNLLYEVELEMKSDGAIKIKKSHYLNENEPLYASTLEEIKLIPYVEDIDNAIRDTIYEQLGVSELEIVEVDSSFPMYIMHYHCAKGLIEVTLMFDILRDQVQIQNLQVKEEHYENLREKAQILKQEKPSFGQIPNRQRFQRAERQGYKSNEAYIQRSYPERQRGNNQEITIARQERREQQPLRKNEEIILEPTIQKVQERIEISKQPKAEQVRIPEKREIKFQKYEQEPVIRQQKIVLAPTPEPKNSVQTPNPKHSLDIDPQTLLQSVSSQTDPLLIPALTEDVDLTEQQFSEILSVVTREVNLEIDSKIKVKLVNRNRYGIRLILEVVRSNGDIRMFEAIFDIDQVELIDWRQIQSVGDADPDVFDEFYRIDTQDEGIRQLISDPELANRIPQNLLSASILYAQKKIANDGVYYSTLAQTTDKRKYKFTFLELPQNRYSQILEFQQTDSSYNPQKQKTLKQFPKNDSLFDLSMGLLKERFFDQIKNEDVAYLGESEEDEQKFYRFIFNGLNGKNQAITQIDKKSLSKNILKWAKLEDGYVELDGEAFKNLPGFNAFSSDVNNFVEKFVDVKKIGRVPQFKNVQVRRLPSIETNYRLFYDEPFPFVLNVGQREKENVILGMERIKVVPRSRYYNNEDFDGFKEISASRVRNNRKFTELMKNLEIQYPDYTWKKSSIETSFKQDQPAQIVYKLIIQTPEATLLTTFLYSKLSQKIKLDSLKKYKQRNESGNYKWNCEEVDEKQGLCKKCSDGCSLTYGKCYQKLDGCELQYGANCYSCQIGYTKINKQCKQSKSLKNTETTIVKQNSIKEASKKQYDYTISGNKQNLQSQFRLSGSPISRAQDNCIKFRGQICIRCANRYFILYGRCQLVQDSCSYYEADGKCRKCFSGYYLGEEDECHKADPLCLNTNSKGQCVSCYKNYILKNGKCFYRTPFQNEHSIDYDDENQLCEQWSGDGTCLKCLGSTFYNTKSGKCQIKDPFCQFFNENLGVCQVCQRGYSKKQGKCSRSRRWND